MDLNKALNISAAGMDAQTMRLRVIAENLANQDTTGSAPGADAYRRKTITFENRVDASTGDATVQVKQIGQDKSAANAALRPIQSGGERRRLRQDAERQQLHRGHGHARGGAFVQRQPLGAASDPQHAGPHDRHAEMSTTSRPSRSRRPTRPTRMPGSIAAMPAVPGAGFGSMLQNALDGAVETGHTAETSAMQAISGEGNLTDVVTALSRAELALQTATAIRDRVVSAYQDIMKMPI